MTIDIGGRRFEADADTLARLEDLKLYSLPVNLVACERCETICMERRAGFAGDLCECCMTLAACRANRSAYGRAGMPNGEMLGTHRSVPFTTAIATVLVARDPHVVDGDRARLSSQCQRIYERLLRGPATNVELAAIALKYTSRISDLRAAGIAVDVVDRDANGRTVYRIAA